MFKLFSKLSLSLILIAVLVLLIFFHYSKVLAPLENSILKILIPVQTIVYKLGDKISNFYLFQNQGEKISKQDYQILEENYKKLIIENSKFKLIEEENQNLKKQLNFLKNLPYKTITTQVIGRSSEPNFYTLILNRGENDGLKEGLPIITTDGVVVATVNKIKKDISYALILTDNRSQIAAAIQNKDKTIGIVSGVHNLSMKMELIPKNEKVSTGDVIVTSGLQENIPKGLIIGQVKRITTEPNDFFQTAYLDSLANLNELTILTILMPEI